MVEKQIEARDQTAKAGQTLQELVTSTKLLQKQVGRANAFKLRISVLKLVFVVIGLI